MRNIWPHTEQWKREKRNVGFPSFDGDRPELMFVSHLAHISRPSSLMAIKIPDLAERKPLKWSTVVFPSVDDAWVLIWLFVLTNICESRCSLIFYQTFSLWVKLKSSGAVKQKRENSSYELGNQSNIFGGYSEVRTVNWTKLRNEVLRKNILTIQGLHFLSEYRFFGYEASSKETFSFGDATTGNLWNTSEKIRTYENVALSLDVMFSPLHSHCDTLFYSHSVYIRSWSMRDFSSSTRWGSLQWSKLR